MCAPSRPLRGGQHRLRGDRLPPAPVGACCIPGARCLLLPERRCVEAGGTYHGAGSSCNDVKCGANGCPCDGTTTAASITTDLFEFITAFMDGDADFNADGITDSRDLMGYLTCFINPPPSCRQ